MPYNLNTTSMKFQFLILMFCCCTFKLAAQDTALNASAQQTELRDVTQRMKLYPNPSSNWMFINHPAATAKTAQLKIIDLTGVTMLVVMVRNKAEQTIINASGLSAGNYLLVFNNGAERGILKFRKE